MKLGVISLGTKNQNPRFPKEDFLSKQTEPQRRRLSIHWESIMKSEWGRRFLSNPYTYQNNTVLVSMGILNLSQNGIILIFILIFFLQEGILVI
jgi:hypothetical protein